MQNHSHKKSSENSELFFVPHIGELSNQYKDELALLYKLKPLLEPAKFSKGGRKV